MMMERSFQSYKRHQNSRVKISFVEDEFNEDHMPFMQ